MQYTTIFAFERDSIKKTTFAEKKRMARKIYITVDTSVGYITVTDQDDSGNFAPNDTMTDGLGTFAMQLPSSSEATLIHKPTGKKFGSFKIAEIGAVTINGDDASISTTNDLRDALSAYFFSSATSAELYKEVAILPDQWKAAGAYASSNNITTGITLLEVDGYLSDWRVVIEKKATGTVYTSGPSSINITINNGEILCRADPTLLTSGVDSTILFQNSIKGGITGGNTVKNIPIGSDLILKGESATAFTNGTYPTTAKIWYRVGNFTTA